MRVIPRKYLYALVIVALGWPLLAAGLTINGIQPFSGIDYPISLRESHPALLGWIRFLLEGVWIFGPAWVAYRCFLYLRNSSVMPLADARRMVAAHGRRMEGASLTSLPKPIDEMEKAIQVVLGESLHSKELVDALRVAYCELPEWEQGSRAFLDLAPYANRNLRFSEMLLKAARSKDANSSVRKEMA